MLTSNNNKKHSTVSGCVNSYKILFQVDLDKLKLPIILLWKGISLWKNRGETPPSCLSSPASLRRTEANFSRIKTRLDSIFSDQDWTRTEKFHTATISGFTPQQSVLLTSIEWRNVDNRETQSGAHRRIQGGPSRQFFSISTSNFLLWEAASETKYCCSPEIKHLGQKKFLG